jgi:hypothetical protein
LIKRPTPPEQGDEARKYLEEKLVLNLEKVAELVAVNIFYQVTFLL